MERLINFGFKMGAKEIIFKSDGCQFVFNCAVDGRDISALLTLLNNHYNDCQIHISRALMTRDELLVTVSPLVVVP